MSDPIRIRRGSKKEFTRVSSLLNSKILAILERLDALEGRITKLEGKKPRKRKKTEEKTE